MTLESERSLGRQLLGLRRKRVASERAAGSALRTGPLGKARATGIVARGESDYNAGVARLKRIAQRI